MSRTRAERLSQIETTLRWDGHKDMVWCYTASRAVRRKLERAGLMPLRRTLSKGRETGWFFQFPYPYLRWGARMRKSGPTPRAVGRRRGV